MNLKLSEIYRLFGKQMTGRDRAVRDISIDTRTIKHGDVFVAIKGNRTDGHKFIKAAVKKGAVLVIAEKGSAGIQVKSTAGALLLLAKYYAAKFKKVKIAAITGSNGKTSTKEMLAAIMECAQGRERVLSSQKSFNNHIGVPLTVFKMNGRLKTAILEMGMNSPGEIARLAAVAAMDAAVITNVGTSHIGRLKSVRNIAKAKGEIFAGAAKGKCAVLNADDGFFKELAGKAKARGLKITSFGMAQGADVRAEIIKTGGSGTIFKLAYKGREEEIEMSLKGTHNVYNAAAAAAAAFVLGAGMKDIKIAMRNFKMEGDLRFEEKEIRGIRVISDCYNANPDSFKAGIETLRSMGLRSPIIASGDMLELGSRSAKYHAVIGTMIARLGIKKLLAFGKYAGDVIKGFVKAGGSAAAAAAYRDKKKMAAALKAAAKPGDTVYVKGSRGNNMEEILKNL